MTDQTNQTVQKPGNESAQENLKQVVPNIDTIYQNRMKDLSGVYDQLIKGNLKPVGLPEAHNKLQAIAQGKPVVDVLKPSTNSKPSFDPNPNR